MYNLAQCEDTLPPPFVAMMCHLLLLFFFLIPDRVFSIIAGRMGGREEEKIATEVAGVLLMSDSCVARPGATLRYVRRAGLRPRPDYNFSLAGSRLWLRDNTPAYRRGRGR